MTDLQKCLMQLIFEINETCEENHLPYALYGRTAGCAEKYGKFTTRCYQFQIMMLAGDIITLKEKLSEKYKEGREIEDFSNNPHLQYNYVRYVDSNSTVFDKGEGVSYSCPGAAISIIPLFVDNITKICEILETGFIYLNGKKIFDERDESAQAEKKGKYIRMTKRMSRILGRKWAARQIYKSLEKEKGKRPKAGLIIRGDRDAVFSDQRKRISADFLFKTRRIPFEGMKLPVSCDSEDLYKILYGDEWETRSANPLPTANSMLVISDAHLPYKDYIAMLEEEGIDMNEVFAIERDRKYYVKNTLEPLQEKAEKHLYSARRSMKRIDLYFYYKNKMDDLRRAEEAGDMETLAEIIKKYKNTARRNWRRGLGFYINKDLQHYAEVFWDNRERTKGFGKKVYDLTPKVYKKKDMDEFLKDYKVEILDVDESDEIKEESEI